ncbi:MAG: 3-hydroxyacyl-CoA dehydrogenase family protein [Gemmatimonadetes bacterium]|nr:3-hydroxyacyl-CoA dehydrogenase family protein [Gemmatimonadota bacterium]
MTTGATTTGGTTAGATVAVIGAGTMGRRLAFDFARAGCVVTLYDAADGVAESALRWLSEHLNAWEGSGRLSAGTTQASLARLRTAQSAAEAVDVAAFVFENVPECLALKRELFARLAPLLADETILVSNTSSLPGSLMADASARPDRFVNANFSHLGHQKVEVMPNPGSSSDTVLRTTDFLRATGFVPILLRQEQFGYASNRVWRAVKKEVLRQVAAGVIAPQDLDRAWMLDWEVPMGPCALMDRIGLDVIRDIEHAYADHTHDPSDRPPQFLEQMVQDGRLGVKSGEGFYRYPDPDFARPDFLQHA